MTDCVILKVFQTIKTRVNQTAKDSVLEIVKYQLFSTRSGGSFVKTSSPGASSHACSWPNISVSNANSFALVPFAMNMLRYLLRNYDAMLITIICLNSTVVVGRLLFIYPNARVFLLIHDRLKLALFLAFSRLLR